MHEGKLIVFAGGEGCGKSTCMNNLKKVLPKEQFIFTREPGGTPSAEIIRDFFLHNELSAFEELLAVKLTRAIHFREKVLPALQKGVHVISDRCHEATWAYQVVAKSNGELRELFSQIDEHSRLGKNVDLWIDFRIDVNTALKRRMDEGTKVNIFDARPLEYHEKVREGLDDFFKQHKQRVFEVNANLPKEKLANTVHNKLQSFLQLSK